MKKYEAMTLNLENLIKELRRLSNLKLCDGTCDEDFPYTKCDICTAIETINFISEDAKYSLLDIEQYAKYRHLNK